MRLLHTSDWHLGRSLHRADLGAAQEAFVDHLVEVASSAAVDVVVVAGDVFDRAIPPLPAVALFESALRRLRAAGPRVVVTSGNHDSASRLGVNSGLIDAAGVHVRTRVGGLADPVLVEDRHGPVAIYAIPYLEPLTVHADLGAAPTHIGCSRRPRRAPPPTSLTAAAVGSRSRTAGSPAGPRRSPSATSPSAVSAGSPRRSSSPSPTPHSATCTGRSRSLSGCATAGRRCRTRSPRQATPRARCSSRSAPASLHWRSSPWRRCRRRFTDRSR